MRRGCAIEESIRSLVEPGSVLARAAETEVLKRTTCLIPAAVEAHFGRNWVELKIVQRAIDGLIVGTIVPSTVRGAV